MKILSIALLLMVFIGCATSNNVEDKPKYKVTPIASSGESRIIGTIVDGVGEPLPFAKVMLIKEGQIVQGVMSDLDGKFVLQKVMAGTYDLEVNLVGYEPTVIKDLEVVASTMVEFELMPQ